jgi:hypothetical protein
VPRPFTLNPVASSENLCNILLPSQFLPLTCPHTEPTPSRMGSPDRKRQKTSEQQRQPPSGPLQPTPFISTGLFGAVLPPLLAQPALLAPPARATASSSPRPPAAILPSQRLLSDPDRLVRDGHAPAAAAQLRHSPSPGQRPPAYQSQAPATAATAAHLCHSPSPLQRPPANPVQVPATAQPRGLEVPRIPPRHPRASSSSVSPRSDRQSQGSPPGQGSAPQAFARAAAAVAPRSAPACPSPSALQVQPRPAGPPRIMPDCTSTGHVLVWAEQCKYMYCACKLGCGNPYCTTCRDANMECSTQ